jgi:hypothetical protein
MVEGAEMIRARSSVLGLLLGGALLLGASAARADGLALASSELPEAAKKTLVKDVAALKAAQPDAFDKVRDIQGIKPEVYKQYRNPIPMAGLELKRLGAGALLPMLSALALDAPAVTLSEQEKTTYVIGLLEASSALRDARGGAVYKAILESKNKPADVLRAAAEAMGRLCGDAELAALKKHTAAGDTLRSHAIRGLGQCRRKESAEHLATLLAEAKDAAAAEPIADALGLVASSWAWKAMGAKVATTAKEVQAIAAKALIGAFSRYDGARETTRKSLRLVESHDALALIATARTTADVATQTALDTLAKQLTPKKQ